MKGARVKLPIKDILVFEECFQPAPEEDFIWLLASGVVPKRCDKRASYVNTVDVWLKFDLDDVLNGPIADEFGIASIILRELNPPDEGRYVLLYTKDRAGFYDSLAFNKVLSPSPGLIRITTLTILSIEQQNALTHYTDVAPIGTPIENVTTTRLISEITRRNGLPGTEQLPPNVILIFNPEKKKKKRCHCKKHRCKRHCQDHCRSNR